MPSRSPTGKVVRTSEDENGPMTASAPASCAKERSAVVACLGSPAVSNFTTLIFLPLMPPLALISSTAMSTATSLVLARLT